MTSTQDPGPVRKFFGWLLMAVGGLIAGTTGACSLYILATSIFSGGDLGYFGGLLSWIALVLVVGGIPCLIGVAVFFGGRALCRPRPRNRPTVPTMPDDGQG